MTRNLPPEKAMFRIAVPKFTAAMQDLRQTLTALLLAGSASLALVSVAISAILLAFAILAAILQWESWRRELLPPASLLWPMILLLLWTVTAVLLGSGSLDDGLIKKCWLFSILLLVPVFARGEKRVRLIYHAMFALAAVSAASGVIQFLANPHRSLTDRIKGFMSIWMTFSGSLMLVLVALAAYALVYGWKKHPWVIPLGLVLSASLYLSQTRNAWIGTCGGIAAVLLLLKRPRILLLLAGLLLGAYLVSPAGIQQRLRAAWDPADPNTRNRIEIFTAAKRLIRAHPWIGVGQKVNIEAPKYRDPSEKPDWMFIHMHNNFLQIAAERGLPGLLIWIWFLAQLGWQAFRVCRSPSAPPAAVFAGTAACGAWVALMAAGMFEYNYGDSEILTVFLFMMSAPQAVSDGIDIP
jgi:putative inorganic carbon (HCO3(-)) transporter